MLLNISCNFRPVSLPFSDIDINQSTKLIITEVGGWILHKNVWGLLLRFPCVFLIKTACWHMLFSDLCPNLPEDAVFWKDAKSIALIAILLLADWNTVFCFVLSHCHADINFCSVFQTHQVVSQIPPKFELHAWTM